MARDGRTVNVFFHQGSLRTRPAQAGCRGQQASSSGMWPGLPLERNQGVQFVQVKPQWQLPRASPVLQRPLFETGVLHLDRGAHRPHKLGKNSPGEADSRKEGPAEWRQAPLIGNPDAPQREKDLQHSCHQQGQVSIIPLPLGCPLEGSEHVGSQAQRQKPVTFSPCPCDHL